LTSFVTLYFKGNKACEIFIKEYVTGYSVRTEVLICDDGYWSYLDSIESPLGTEYNLRNFFNECKKGGLENSRFVYYLAHD